LGKGLRLAFAWRPASAKRKLDFITSIPMRLFLAKEHPMRLGVLLVIAVSVSAIAGQENAIKDELKKLEGKWAQVSVEADGKALTDKQESPKVTVTIAKDKWIETPT